MDESGLLTRLSAYGADMRGIEERFMGDGELYETCFAELLAEPSFAALREALDAGRYDDAFAAAHALKGLAGNLGLTPLFAALSALVEELRAKRYARAPELGRAVEAQLRALEAVGRGEAPAAEEAAPSRPKARFWPKRSWRAARLPLLCVLTLVALTALVQFTFSGLIRSYEETLSAESSSHLEELITQIRLYVEQRVDSDWRAVHSVANAFESGLPEDDEARLLGMARREKEIWGVSDVVLYTAEGRSISADGEVRMINAASDTAYNARILGEYMTVVDSSITYTVPVDTDFRYQGAEVVAVSVVQDIEPFLSDMGISSFGGSAYIYLTRENGVVMSVLDSGQAPIAYNVTPLLTAMGYIEREDDLRDIMLGEGTEARLAGDMYVVTAPVRTRHENMRLFYFAPESAVNQTRDGFIRYVTGVSVAVVAVFSLAAMCAFLLLYRSRKRRMDRALVDRERTFDLLVRNTKTAFGLFSVDQPRPLYVSQNAERIVGRPDWTLAREDGVYRMRAESGEETEALLAANEELAAWDGVGEFRSGPIPGDSAADADYFSLQFTPIDDARREYVGIAQDVTQAHDREEAVRNALAMAERSNAAKNRFLSNMSHDIRTPMNAIVNMTDFAIESVGDRDRQLEYLKVIRESSDHLLRLVNDVLDMSRIESGQAVVSAEPFDLRAELDAVCDIMRPLCHAKKQLFLTRFADFGRTHVLGDRIKLSQVLINLLSNAVKFTPDKGAIRFTAEEVPSLQPDTLTVRFVVEDNGIGIAPEDIQRIFEPFVRADDRRVSGVEGTGLGLPICKSYVEAMGGTLSCESELSGGSAFTAELFFRRADSAPERRAPVALAEERPFEGMRCLLCEDNPTNRLIGKTMLERIGFLVDVARDGREATDLWTASPPGRYDVIYMDIQMPVMDGYHAAVAIRESGHPRAAAVPIIAMTANVFAEDVEKARIAGMNGHIGKPITMLDLIDETGTVLHKGG